MGNEQEEVKSRLDYLTALNESIGQAIAVGQSNPRYLQLILKNTSWALSAFPRSRIVRNETDDIIAEILEENKQMAETTQPKEPMPDELISQAEVMSSYADQMNAQTKAKEAQIKEQKVQ
ncbi:hypothetical protein AGMMS49950_07660 [Endomicrobiia bacterium]|nr:hypothetical protein AGMMS49950_07660 [Endomicrobiia bacterium]